VGNVAKRPDGRWRARYRDPAGRERSQHFSRKLDAQRWLATVEVAVGRGEWLDPSLGKVTVGEWGRQWFANQSQLKPTTRERYRGLIAQQLDPTWAPVPLQAVTNSAVATWVSGLTASGLSGSTVRHAHRVLSMILGAAVRDGRIPRNPAVGVRLPRVASSDKRFLTHEQVARLAEAVGAPHDLVVLVLAYTGLRWGELAALRVRDIDLIRSRLSVQRSMTEVSGRAVIGTPKNHQRRTVPVPAFLRDRLEGQVRGCDPEAFAFPSRQGAVLRNGNFRSQVFDAAAKEVGLAGFTPHELRHTAASLAIAAGANIKAVQRMLGHASAAMTLDVYAGLFGDDLDDLARRLDEAATSSRADQVRTRSASDDLNRLVPPAPQASDQDVRAVPPAGLEPATYGLEGRCSIH